jgi:hypothetical protein
LKIGLGWGETDAVNGEDEDEDEVPTAETDDEMTEDEIVTEGTH